MKSAGQVYNQSNGQQASAMAPIGFTPVGSTMGNPYAASPNIQLKLNETQSNAYLDKMGKQQTWSNALSAGAMGANTILQSVSMALNYGIQSKYFGLQETIASNQHDIAGRAMDLENKKLDVTRQMNTEQLTFQKSLARIQQQTQVTISRIQERGKTNRAEIFSSMNAFQRTNYYSGQPTFKTGVVS
jgi:hypothetical protein